MNFFKRKSEWIRLQNSPALTKFEVCDKLQPFLLPLKLTFTENEVCFPKPLPPLQLVILGAASGENLYKESILFADIVAMAYSCRGVRLQVRTGHVFHFMKDCPLWYVDNPFHYGEPSFWALLGYTFCEAGEIFVNSLFYRLRPKQRAIH